MELFLAYKIWIMAFIFARVLGITMMIPFFATSFVPAQLRAFLVIFISYMILPTVTENFPLNESVITIVFYIFLNFLIGIMIGIITQIMFYAVQFAGELFDFQMGFALMNVINPIYEEEVSILGELTFLLSTIVFFIFKGHLMMYTIIIDSFKKIPILLDLNQNVFLVFSVKISDIFLIGLQFAMPVTAFMIFTNIILGIMSKLAPQMNVFVVGLPLNILVGFSIFSVVIVTWEEQFTKMFFQIFQWLQNTMILFLK